MLSILIVEDSPTILMVTEQALLSEGHTVHKARDGQEALRLARQQKPDLILLDVIIPKANGFQVCRQLKAAPDTAHIPVVMLTSKDKEKDRYWGIEQGADAYITKPIDEQALLRLVGEFAPQVGS